MLFNELLEFYCMATQHRPNYHELLRDTNVDDSNAVFIRRVILNRNPKPGTGLTQANSPNNDQAQGAGKNREIQGNKQRIQKTKRHKTRENAQECSTEAYKTCRRVTEKPGFI